MLMAGRRFPKPPRSRLVVITHSNLASPHPFLSFSSETPPSKGKWASDLFTGDFRTRAISRLSIDRDNSTTFYKFGKSSRKAAVLVPFCYDVEGRPGILYNLRSTTVNTHKGQISFPGGTFEPEDNDDPVAAALRETHEELGISKHQVDVWTTCRPFSIIFSKIQIIPVVGFINSGPMKPDQLEISLDEVDHAFIITLEHLCDPSNWGNMQLPGALGRVLSFSGVSIPAYLNLHEKLQDNRLWGLTAFITHLVLTAFIPEKYNRKVKFISLNDGKGDK